MPRQVGPLLCRNWQDQIFGPIACNQKVLLSDDSQTDECKFGTAHPKRAAPQSGSLSRRQILLEVRRLIAARHLERLALGAGQRTEL